MCEPCDICGDVGYEEVLLSCYKCCIARQHIYCKQVFERNVPEFWVCEECMPRKVSPKSDRRDCFDSMQASGSSKLCVDILRQNRFAQKKVVKSGRVKFLSTEEAIKLASGAAPGNGSHSQRDCGLKHGAPNSMPSTGLKIISQKFSPPRVKTNPSRNDDAEKSSMIIQRALKISKETEGKQVPPTSLKDHVGNEQSVDAFTPPRKVKTSVMEPETEKISSLLSPSGQPTTKICLGQNFHSVTHTKDPNVEERKQLISELKFRLYLQYCPARLSTWKGDFRFTNSSTPVQFYSGFQAQPPCRLHHKAYEFAKKLPSILQVKLLPRCDLLGDLFHHRFPDFHDISLYFFPGDNAERSKENNYCLFELLESKNSMMITCIDGVELLIFTSKQLPVDSQDVMTRLNTRSFLWGVFCSVKNDQILRKVQDKVPPLVPQCAHDRLTETNDSEGVDMEVDMEGGKIVGIVDKIVAKDDCGNETPSCSENVRLVAYPSPVSEESRSELETKKRNKEKLPIEAVEEEGRGEAFTGDNDKSHQAVEIKSQVKFEDDGADFCHELQTKSPSRWTPPPAGWLKLNIEGCSNSKGIPVVCRAAGVIRDDSGNWIIGYSHDLSSCKTLTAVLWALIHGLQILQDRGFKRILVESVCLEAVEYLEDKRAPPAFDVDAVLVEYCRDLIKQDYVCKASHIHQEANKSANWLATNLAGSTILQSPPPEMVPFLQNDCNGAGLSFAS